MGRRAGGCGLVLGEGMAGLAELAAWASANVSGDEAVGLVLCLLWDFLIPFACAFNRASRSFRLAFLSSFSFAAAFASSFAFVSACVWPVDAVTVSGASSSLGGRCGDWGSGGWESGGFGEWEGGSGDWLENRLWFALGEGGGGVGVLVVGIGAGIGEFSDGVVVGVGEVFFFFVGFDVGGGMALSFDEWGVASVVLLPSGVLVGITTITF